ncbi:MAG: omptin family outer membrane protease [Treponema sp.]|jgi:outer membrane protease|nr:omptin family outer membrane protease [Treponema sp.]
MRNITAFRILVITGVLFAAGGAFAQEPEISRETENLPSFNAGGNRRYSLGISPQFGMVYGQVEEIVYSGGKTKNELLSQLLWDMKPLFYCGVLLDFGRTDPMEKWGFFSGLSFKAGIPARSGKMEDRDWQSTESTALTNFSSHDNETKEFFWLEGTAGVSFPIKSLVALRTYIGVSYMRFSFSGWDGYLRYATVNNGQYGSVSDAQEIALSGKVINYTQDWLLAAPGVSAEFRFLRLFSGALFFQISPLIWCADVDEHLLAGKEFKDYTRWGLFLEPRARLAFNPGERLSLSLEFAYRYITGSRGEVYQRPLTGGEYSLGGEAGAGLSMMDTGFLVKIHL